MRRNLKNLFVLGGLLLGASLYAQEKTVTGTVTDSDGLPVADAVVKTTSGKEAYTDENGVFSIEAKQGDLVTVEAMGLPTQTFSVGTGSEYKVTLKPSETVELEGAVVTALGITRDKRSLGYASQEVKGDVIQAGRGSNALQSLSGNVAGAQITAPSSLGGSTRITLRGIGSITGENRPLIVIDGIPLANNNVNDTNTQRGGGGRDYGDGAFDINPDDVESINVLKGGPASALYGSRAVNGVIMIKTKSGKKGREEITVNTGVAFESINQIPKLQSLYGGGGSSEFETVNIGGKDYQVVDYATDESWGPRFNNQEVLQWYAFDPEFASDYMKTTPWQASKNDVKSFFNTGVAYTNSVSFTKSYEATNLRVSLSNVNQTGIVPNSSLEKTTASINLSNKFSDVFTVTTNLTYTRTDGFNRPEVGYGDNSVAQKMFQWGQRQLDYNQLKDYKLANGNQRSWNRTSWDDATPAYSDNPYWVVNENTSKDKRDRFYGNVEFKYDIAPGLYAIANVMGDTYDMQISERVAVGSQAMSKYSEAYYKFTEMNYEGRLHFDKKWGDFSLNAFAGVNRRHKTQSRLSSSTNGGLVVPNYYFIGNSLDNPTTSSFRETSEVNSIYGMISLGYKNMLFLEATGRNDWFSTLPIINNSYFYPSVTGSFVFSEVFKPSWLNFGKLRAGVSQVSSDLTPYQTGDVLGSSINFNGTPTFIQSNTKMNPLLKPEIKDTWEVGLEASMFNNRFGFDVTYYNEKRTDLLVPVQHSWSTGYEYKWLNAGEMTNEGVEALVNIVPLRNQDFEWRVTWNFAKNNNKVVKVSDEMDSYNLTNAPFSVQLWAISGQQYGQIMGTDFVYDDQGNKVVDANGFYEKSEVKNLGSIIPDYNMGIRNTFTYKGVALSALIDIQKGGNFFSTSHMWGMYSGMLEETAANGVRENGVVADGVMWDEGTKSYVKNTTEVSAYDYYKAYYNGVDSQNVFDADYIKLREVTLSYTFPKKWAGPFANVTVSAFGRNLATWGLDKKGFDPEMASYGSGNIQGIEGGSLPSTRTYGMNLKLQF
ncbi:SusC/RagA family TonB-linked outer membrane protein [Empedobacter sp. GD03861]|uniref:SusC/RagA family TonB-linked outer membrane protein n=1 Tax=Empedobacter sp. GD03861 TaxID=2975390 RepID=UPI00244AB101|nr:SusC/RagA family TonB-linked outer membrane protein [Empedobacter sp. GD03861]MDH0673701.1 SusC/RagA family TonB-linked outer membrane protein [Empedobacter sp. GD03861]